MTISGGLVSIEDGNKKAEDYSPARKVRVELKFDVPEGSDEAQRIVDDVARVANNKVEELLGRQPAAGTTTTTFQPASAAAPVEEKKKRGRPAVAPTVAPAPDTKEAYAAPDTKEAYAAKAAAAEAKTNGVAPPSDELDELLGGGLQAEPISDKQLLDAIKAVNTNPAMIQRIKETVKAFCPREDKAGFRVADIAQEHRQMFIDKLQGLPQD
jgi:hypothetical protein